MGKWLRALTKIHYYHYPIIGFFGLVATVVLYRPEVHLITIGRLRFDVFYVVVVAFGVLLVLSLVDEYDLEGYEPNQ